MSSINSHKTKFTFIHVNTKFRPNYYNTSSSNFNYQFPNSYSNITSIKLDSICIPNTWFLFSSEKKNNIFSIKTTISGGSSVNHYITIPDGNYTSDQLEEYLNGTYFYLAGNDDNLKNIKFSIDDYSLKSKFSVITATDAAETGATADGAPTAGFSFDLIFSHEQIKNICLGAGWILGFRYGEYTGITNSGDAGTISSISSEGLFDGGGDRYIYFCLDDFNHSSLNPHEVCFEKYSINESVLAKIYLADGQFAVNIDDSSNSANNTVKTRVFSGPIDLSKINVKILDQFGDIIDLNNMDFSFSLQVCISN